VHLFQRQMIVGGLDPLGRQVAREVRRRRGSGGGGRVGRGLGEGRAGGEDQHRQGGGQEQGLHEGKLRFRNPPLRQRGRGTAVRRWRGGTSLGVQGRPLHHFVVPLPRSPRRTGEDQIPPTASPVRPSGGAS